MSTGPERTLAETDVSIGEEIDAILHDKTESPYSSDPLNRIHNQALKLDKEPGKSNIHHSLMQLEDDAEFDAIVLDHNVVLDIARRSSRFSPYNHIDYRWNIPLWMMDRAIEDDIDLYVPEDMGKKLVRYNDWNASKKIGNALDRISYPLDMEYDPSFSDTHPGMEEDAKIARNSSRLSSDVVIATYDSDFTELADEYNVQAAAPERINDLLS